MLFLFFVCFYLLFTKSYFAPPLKICSKLFLQSCLYTVLVFLPLAFYVISNSIKPSSELCNWIGLSYLFFVDYFIFLITPKVTKKQKSWKCILTRQISETFQETAELFFKHKLGFLGLRNWVNWKWISTEFSRNSHTVSIL